jgi:hypothetical protein
MDSCRGFQLHKDCLNFKSCFCPLFNFFWGVDIVYRSFPVLFVCLFPLLIPFLFTILNISLSFLGGSILQFLTDI